jgi:hypothetical protein
VAVDDALDAEPLAVRKALDGGQRPQLVARGGGDRLGDRVLGGVLQRAGEPQRVLARGPVRGGDAGQAHPAGRDRAGLVEHDRVDAARGLEDLRALDEQPSCAPRPVPTSNAVGSPGRARTGRR